MSLTSRWQTKLTALGLAVAVFYFTAGQISETRSFTAVLDAQVVADLPQGYAVARISPRELEVSVSGPRRLIEEVARQGLQPQVRLTAADLQAAGPREFELNPRLLGLPPGLSLDTRGGVIRVEIAALAQRSLPVADRPAVEGLAAGLRADIVTTLGQAAFSGPANLLAEMAAAGRVPVQSIRLTEIEAGLVEPVVVSVPLVPILPAGVRSDGPPLVATITVSPEQDERATVGPLPVEVLAAPDFWTRYRVELATPVAPIAVRGPRNLLAQLKPQEQLRIYVDLANVPESDSPVERPLRLLGPRWLQLVSGSVRVTVKPLR
jgi:YbbR domain-containing protein